MGIYSDLGGSSAPVDSGLTEAEALLEAKKVSGYLGLLSSYYFGGTGTVTEVTPDKVNQWIDVNLTVDPAGTFDYRPQDMVDADAAGFEGGGTSSGISSNISLSGSLPVASVPPGAFVAFSVNDYSPNVVVEFFQSEFNELEWEVYLIDQDLLNNGFGPEFFILGALSTNEGTSNIFFDGATGAIDTLVTQSTTIAGSNGLTVDLSAITYSSPTQSLTVSSSDGSTQDPYLFTLCGLTQQSFGKMRVTGLFTPDIDESQLDVRLLFTPNSSGQFGQFSIAEQAATMSQGAGVEYFVEPTITFFVGDTIEEIGTVGASDAGRLQLQIRSSAEGEFNLRGLTLYIHS